jgi:hypothetical protein
MSFTLWFEDIRGLDARRVLENVLVAEKRSLGDLRVYDLICEGNRALLWGVYFFFNREGECLYVGKNAARKFVERIPVHLCLWDDDWMNHLVKRIQKYGGHTCLFDAAVAARDYTLLLIAISDKEEREIISPLEKFFRIFSAPKYNQLPMKERYKRLDLGLPLSQLLDEL